MSRLSVRAAGALTVDQLAGVREIYEGAFSQDLRVPFADLASPGEADRTFVAVDGETPAGFAVVRLLGSAGWSFLRYYAIAGELRGQGLGREFWQLLRRALAAQAWPERLVFEVEDPAEAAGDDAETVIRERRITFWSGCGAHLLPVPGYVLPDYTHSGLTEPMLLMAYAEAGQPPLEGDRLRHLVLAIYADRYGLPPGDPLVTRALASVSA